MGIQPLYTEYREKREQSPREKKARSSPQQTNITIKNRSITRLVPMFASKTSRVPDPTRGTSDLRLNAPIITGPLHAKGNFPFAYRGNNFELLLRHITFEEIRRLFLFFPSLFSDDMDIQLSDINSSDT